MNQEQPLFDKNGNEIREFDLIKLFHFKGRNSNGNGRKIYYMYKWVQLKELNGKLHWYANHLSGQVERDGYWIGFGSDIDESRRITDAEIVQSHHDDRYISK